MSEDQVRVNSRLDQSGTVFLPLPYLATGAAPIKAPGTGVWKGYAVAAASGAVTIAGSDFGTLTLGTASAAGQAFFFQVGLTLNEVITLTNCTIVGGVITES